MQILSNQIEQMPQPKTQLVLLQREFRLTSLPMLVEAIESGDNVILAYLFDPQNTIGGADSANSLWLAHSLNLLQQTVQKHSGALWIVSGDFASSLSMLIEHYDVQKVSYAFQVGQLFDQQQQSALAVCQTHKVALNPNYDEFLLRPEQIMNQQGAPYLVFTPFYKKLLSVQDQIEPLGLNESRLDNLSATNQLSPLSSDWLELHKQLNELTQKPWAQSLMQNWQVGEKAAWEKVKTFVETDLEAYAEDRDYPNLSATSRLSAHLHFGELNLRSLYFYLHALIEDQQINPEAAMSWFRQLVWKEFARHLLVHFPQSEFEPFQAKYKAMQWQTDDKLIQLWSKGQTGIPIIDAGMQELWKTGTMHNRVRMLVASFLTKNLNQSWLSGKGWFEHTLLDADLANNVMGWQWVAGCGVDASPYYRLFNPVTQSIKFDVNGDYIKHWLPVLKPLSKKAVHEPWAHRAECELKGIKLGADYPEPLFDLKQSRAEHLARVEAMKRF